MFYCRPGNAFAKDFDVRWFTKLNVVGRRFLDLSFRCNYIQVARNKLTNK